MASAHLALVPAHGEPRPPEGCSARSPSLAAAGPSGLPGRAAGSKILTLPTRHFSQAVPAEAPDPEKAGEAFPDTVQPDAALPILNWQTPCQTGPAAANFAGIWPACFARHYERAARQNWPKQIYRAISMYYDDFATGTRLADLLPTKGSP
jgi:hypothetical protein